MQKTFRPILAALVLIVAQTSLLATMPAEAGVKGSDSPVDVDAHGIAMGGYDPVAYFDGGKPTPGVATISASHDGARYLFASAEHKSEFLKNPEKYLPQFGGFCALGTAFGEKVDGDPKTGQVVNGKLYLNYNTKALDLFNKDQSGTITKANANWPAVKDKVF